MRALTTSKLIICSYTLVKKSETRAREEQGREDDGQIAHHTLETKLLHLKLIGKALSKYIFLRGK